jgi:diacylglycerol kinase family enzyme
LFWTVTGNDFGRSISWAKQQPNAVSEQIKTALSSSSPKTK